MPTTLPLTGLQDWYLRACDGELDASPGVHLDACDQGWALTVDLDRAGLADRRCPDVEIRRTGDDWIHTWSDGEAFHADCGPLSLTEAIKRYLDWAE